MYQREDEVVGCVSKAHRRLQAEGLWPRQAVRLTLRFPAVCSSICVCQLLSTDSGHTISVARGPLTDGGCGGGLTFSSAAASASWSAASAWAFLPVAVHATILLKCHKRLSNRQHL